MQTTLSFRETASAILPRTLDGPVLAAAVSPAFRAALVQVG
jgi:hypothetical protein